MRFFNLLGVIAVLGVGYHFYQGGFEFAAADDPVAASDAVAIRQRLVALGRAQWEYHAEHSRYATLEELESSGDLPGGLVQRGYGFSGTASATAFRITAEPIGEERADWPTLEITEALKVVEK